jgi:hypothetical protein
MSRYVTRGGKLYPARFFDPLNPKPGDCPHCGGTGEYPESIDEERYDVMVPCFMCRRFCTVCKQWVKKIGHECQEVKGDANNATT